MSPKADTTSYRGWGLLLVICSTVGFLATMVLTIDRIRLLSDPQVALVCDISPFVTCGPVMASQAGALFGFPNPLLGIAGFAIVGTTGAALLADARLARWYLAALEIGCLLAAVFLTWLQTQSLYVIGALCLWCMVVWAVTIPIVVITTAATLSAGAFGDGVRRFGRAIQSWRVPIIAIWYLAIVTAIALRFYREFALLWFGVAL
ncbi:MAG: vitamin K epoxide reductase family protein [Microlunatus sp.]|nr:vitamin K epoxide reductase family protein [Microlunatus sp.]